jgi:hypothetical protein
MSHSSGENGPGPRAEIARRLSALHGLPILAAAVDREGYIVAVNEPWKEFYQQFGLDVPNFGVGEKYGRFFDRDPQSVARRSSDLKALLAGEIGTASHLYVCHTGQGDRRILVVGFATRTPEPAGATMLHLDVTELIAAEELIDRGRPDALGTPALDADDWPRLTQAIETAVARALAAWVPGRGRRGGPPLGTPGQRRGRVGAGEADCAAAPSVYAARRRKDQCRDCRDAVHVAQYGQAACLGDLATPPA